MRFKAAVTGSVLKSGGDKDNKSNTLINSFCQNLLGIFIIYCPVATLRFDSSSHGMRFPVIWGRSLHCTQKQFPIPTTKNVTCSLVNTFLFFGTSCVFHDF